MFQREVADKILAAPDSKAYGPLGILIGHLFEVERLLEVSPGSFRPAPKVHATVTRWRRREDGLQEEDRRDLERTLSIGFSNRRKKLSNNFKVLGTSEQLATPFSDAGLTGSERAEKLRPACWLRLARSLGRRDYSNPPTAREAFH